MTCFLSLAHSKESEITMRVSPKPADIFDPLISVWKVKAKLPAKLNPIELFITGTTRLLLIF